MPVPVPLVSVAQWCLDVITASHVGGYLEPGRMQDYVEGLANNKEKP
jgi:hypothetical protein